MKCHVFKKVLSIQRYFLIQVTLYQKTSFVCDCQNMLRTNCGESQTGFFFSFLLMVLLLYLLFIVCSLNSLQSVIQSIIVTFRIMFSINLFQQFWRLLFIIKQLNFSNVEKRERERVLPWVVYRDVFVKVIIIGSVDPTRRLYVRRSNCNVFRSCRFIQVQCQHEFVTRL